MAKVGDVLVAFRADVGQFTRGIRDAQADMGKFQTSVTRVQAPVTQTTTIVNKLERALGGAAFAAAGVPGPLGKAASIMLQFGTGGAVTLGVIAGLGAIAVAWQAIRMEANLAAEAQKKAAEVAGTVGRTPLTDMGLQVATTQNELSAARKKAAASRVGFLGLPVQSAAGLEAIRKADAEVVRLETNLKKLTQAAIELSVTAEDVAAAFAIMERGVKPPFAPQAFQLDQLAAYGFA